MRFARTVLALTVPLMLTACASSSTPGFLQAYKMDIHQGNILDEDKVNRLRPGMSENEVRFLLGSPMLVDIFHQNRWDYVYYNKPGKEEPQQRRLSLFFENGRLARIEPPLETAKSSAP